MRCERQRPEQTHKESVMASTSQEQLDRAFQIGFQVEGARATLGALVDILAAGQPDPAAFRKAIFDRVVPNLPEQLAKSPPDFAEKVREGSRAFAAEVLGLGFEILKAKH